MIFTEIIRPYGHAVALKRSAPCYKARLRGLSGFICQWPSSPRYGHEARCAGSGECSPAQHRRSRLLPQSDSLVGNRLALDV